MRVGINALACVPERSGGDATYVRELVRHLLAADGTNEYVLFVAPWNRRLFPAPSSQLEHVVCPAPPGSFVARALWEQAVLPRYVRAARLDVLHAPVNVAPLRSTVPLVLTLHEAEPFMPGAEMPAPLRVYWRLFRALSARRARRILCVSQAAARELRRYMAVPPEKLSVIYHGIDVDRFGACRGRTESDGSVLWVGRSYPRKNVVRLVEAYGSLPAATRDAHRLVLAGVEGWGSGKLHRRVAELGVSDTVRYLGRVGDDQLPCLYARASVFAFPSLHESFGLPVLEALASGTPVICSDIPALHEVAGDVATYVDPTSARAVAAALESVLVDRAAREHALVEGPRRARRFTWHATAAATADEYRRALGQPASAGSSMPC